MLQEIQEVINTLQHDGYISEGMTQKEVVKLVYRLLMASNQQNVANTLTMINRCAFVRRQITGVLDSDDCVETLNMLRKNKLVELIATQFQISPSHAYTVCGTCIEIFKAEKKIK